LLHPLLEYVSPRGTTTGPDTVGPPWWMCAKVGASMPERWNCQQTLVGSIVMSAVPELVPPIAVGTSAELVRGTWKLVPPAPPVPARELPSPRVMRTTARAAPSATTAAASNPTSSGPPRTDRRREPSVSLGGEAGGGIGGTGSPSGSGVPVAVLGTGS